MENLMPFQNDFLFEKKQRQKNKIAYLSALTLLFSYAETALPRITPFFRLGLGNTVSLLALKSGEIPFGAFMILSVLKAFYFVSLAQSAVSSIFMFALFLLNKKCGGKIFSVYGISVFASAMSAFVQIFCCSIYLGSGTFVLLGPMLIFNTASGMLTAFLSEKISLENAVPFEKTDFEEKQKTDFRQILFALGIIFASTSVFFIKNIPVLVAIFVAAFLTQKACKRKILLLPHISLWIFILISTIFSPEGKIIFKIWNFSITQGAILSGIQKSLRLSATTQNSRFQIFKHNKSIKICKKNTRIFVRVFFVCDYFQGKMKELNFLGPSVSLSSARSSSHGTSARLSRSFCNSGFSSSQSYL